MTLRLALVIEGDGSGARKALEETRKAVEDLGQSAEAASRKVAGASKVEWNEAEFDRARNGLAGAADEAGRAAESIAAVGVAGGRAAPEIQKAGDAAETAGGKFSSLGTLVLGAAGGLAAGLAISAVGEGLRLAAGYAGDLVREIVSNTPRIERDLKSHAELVERIKGAYGRARGAASDYNNDSRGGLLFEQEQNIKRLRDDLQRAAGQLDMGPGASAFLGPYAAAVEQFRDEVRDGATDVIAFRARIAEIASAEPIDSPFRTIGETIRQASEQAAGIQEELRRALDLYKGLKGDADAAAVALGGSADKFRLAGEAAADALPALREIDELLKSIGRNSGAAAVVPAPSSGGASGSFAAGGFTGHMPADRVAGFVHGQEYVFDAASTAAIGVDNLDAMRRGVRGYAGGGYVGVLPMTGGSNVAAGGSPTIALADEFRLLQGSLRQFGTVLLSSRDAGQALASVIQSVSQRFLDFSLNALDRLLLGGGGTGSAGGAFGLIGNLLGLGGGTGYFPPAPVVGFHTLHGGGLVGRDSSGTRFAPPSVFIGAPRLHGGGWLKPGERPVIAMDGEEIGWPDQLARKYGGGRGGGTVNNYFHVETPSPKAFAESRATVARAAGRLAARSGRHS